MKKPGIYFTPNTGNIWLVEKLEFYPREINPDGKSFSIIEKGELCTGQKIHKCLITKDKFKFFKYIGEL